MEFVHNCVCSVFLLPRFPLSFSQDFGHRLIWVHKQFTGEDKHPLFNNIWLLFFFNICATWNVGYFDLFAGVRSTSGHRNAFPSEVNHLYDPWLVYLLKQHKTSIGARVQIKSHKNIINVCPFCIVIYFTVNFHKELACAKSITLLCIILPLPTFQHGSRPFVFFCEFTADRFPIWMMHYIDASHITLLCLPFSKGKTEKITTIHRRYTLYIGSNCLEKEKRHSINIMI